MQPGIDIGPAVDEAQLETVLRLHRDRQEGRRRLLLRRQPPDRRRPRQRLISSSRRFSPTSPRAMTIAQEEIFGPVLAIMRAKDFEDAMRIANNIPFGLSVVRSRPPTSRDVSNSSTAPKPAC